jgi:hypothetical protein
LKDAFLKATNNLNNAAKDKFITEFLNKTIDLSDVSADD